MGPAQPPRTDKARSGGGDKKVLFITNGPPWLAQAIKFLFFFNLPEQRSQQLSSLKVYLI